MKQLSLGDGVVITSKVNGVVRDQTGKTSAYTVRLSDGQRILIASDIELHIGADYIVKGTINGAVGDRRGNIKAIKVQLENRQLLIIDPEHVSIQIAKAKVIEPVDEVKGDKKQK